MNTRDLDRNQLCEYLDAANKGTLSYPEVIDLISQAESYLNKSDDSTIVGHLNSLKPKLSWLEDREQDKMQFAKERKWSFWKSLGGVVFGAIIGIFGSIYSTQQTIKAQTDISDKNSRMTENLCMKIVNELSQINQSINKINNSSNYESINSPNNNMKKRINQLKKNDNK